MLKVSISDEPPSISYDIIMEKRFEIIQDRDYEDEVEFTPKVRGFNEESISFDDPEIQAKEKVSKVSLNTNTKQCIIY